MTNAQLRKRKRVFMFVRLAVVTGGIIWGLIWVSRDVGWNNLAKTFVGINPAVFVLALGVFVGGQIIIGLRWWLLLRAQSIFIKFWAAVRLHFLGLFYNNFMPSAVGGDVVRAWYVTRHTDKKFEAALSVFVDRGIGLLSTLLIAMFFYAVFMPRHDGLITRSQQGSAAGSIWQYKWLFMSVVLAALAAFSVLLLSLRGRRLLAKAWAQLIERTARILAKFRDAIVIYCSKPLVIIAFLGLTIFMQITTIAGFWFLGVDLGIEAGIIYYFVFFTLSWVLGVIPVSIGGVVVVEGLLIYLFIHFAGVAEEQASALALCQRAIWMLASLPGAAIHLAGAHLPKDFFVDYDSTLS